MNEEAKAYEEDLAGQFAKALSRRRRAVKLTAIELSRRTEELGYPISRGAIAKMESNSRGGKIDVAELLVLAAALKIPPVLMLFPDFPYRAARVLPQVIAESSEAVAWLAGEVVFPQDIDARHNNSIDSGFRSHGTKLISADFGLRRAMRAEADLTDRLLEYQLSGASDLVAITQQAIEVNNRELALRKRELEEALVDLWEPAEDRVLKIPSEASVERIKE
ncbi:XRE family transcriptional regulator [Mycobacterium sp. Root265]|uniref:XRE family transcriptional regulator n=1 Tax=Mycobacterium sp. Root265 TaxID=1736504 RepID=UPI0012E3DAFD|nr:XRE family transcriptional regulator [Mycobacterium sp. Root265]